jgi:uncharacterized Ntn-hydrolase superfamily protein
MQRRKLQEDGGRFALLAMQTFRFFHLPTFTFCLPGFAFSHYFHSAKNQPYFMYYRILLALLLFSTTGSAQVYNKQQPLAHTYSIVARDSITGEMAVAVQSHWYSVGSVVAWGEAGAGVVATQSFVNKSFGLRGIALLKSGKTAQQTLAILLSDDPGREVRQVAIIDTNGNVATHTGNKCIDHAGHVKGVQFSVQANMMLTDKVPAAMARSFEQSGGKPLAERVLLALQAAQAVGGDIRGQQAAALLVVRGRATNEPWNDRLIDLRVDDHPQPIQELERQLKLFRAYEHMNNGDLATEKNDMKTAMEEYGAAMKMFPHKLEMKYWTAITLANNKDIEGALKMLKPIFRKDPNWKELTKRLPKVGLLTVDEKALARILAL